MLGGGGGVSHPSQLTTGLVIKSVTTSPTLAGERMLFILQVCILSEQMKFYFSQKHIFPNTAKVGLVIIKLLTTSPGVSWRGWETPPPPQHNSSHTLRQKGTALIADDAQPKRTR